jgi:hypothetical protein
MAVCQYFIHEVRNAPTPLLSDEVGILAAEKVSPVECDQAEECRYIFIVAERCDLLNSLFVSH